MTVTELADGAERLLTEVRALAAKHKTRDANRALWEAREREVWFPPSGCGVCGIGRPMHAWRRALGVGWHQHETPTTDQIKTRMLARRYGSAADAQDTNTEK